MLKINSFPYFEKNEQRQMLIPKNFHLIPRLKVFFNKSLSLLSKINLK